MIGQEVGKRLEMSVLPAVEEEIRLVLRAQKGDRQAFGELVCRYHSRVTDVVYRMCGDPDLAEDAAQEAMIRAWQRLPDYRPHAPFRNWLYRIAIHVALDILRREKPALQIDDVQLSAPVEKMEMGLEHKERAHRVRQAVLALPEASRAVLILREYEDLSYQEIAETLGIPAGTVMSRLNYARKCLAEHLKVYLEEA